MPTLATTIFANAWHHDGSGWWILFPLFWILLVGAIVLLLRSRGGWGPPRAAAGHRETALDVLDGRYARGEIDVDEYRQRRSVLTERERPSGD